MEMEMAKTQRLRDDLVGEKTRNADIIGRIRGVCKAIETNGGRIDPNMDDIKVDIWSLIMVINNEKP